MAQELGVINKPDIVYHELDYADKFIVLGSDGVWEWLSNN
jgi:serine/threonine protein phosphatase PrpC